MNPVVSLSATSLKYRIGEYDQHTIQINMLITETPRVHSSRRREQASHSPSFSNCIYFYFMLHEIWLGIYLLYLMNFLFEHSPWPVASLREISVFLEIQTIPIHFNQIKSARRQKYLQSRRNGTPTSPGNMEYGMGLHEVSKTEPISLSQDFSGSLAHDSL